MHALTGGKASWFDAYLGALETRAREAGKPVHAVIADVDAAVVNIYGLYLIMQESLTAAAEMCVHNCLAALMFDALPRTCFSSSSLPQVLLGSGGRHHNEMQRTMH